MGHSSHEPWLYVMQEGEEDREMAEMLEAWQASEQLPDAPRVVPAHEQPEVQDTEPFPEVEEPPPAHPWDNGRMFGRSAYPGTLATRGRFRAPARRRYLR